MLLIAIYLSSYSHRIDDPALARQFCVGARRKASLGRPKNLTRKGKAVFPNGDMKSRAARWRGRGGAR